MWNRFIDWDLLLLYASTLLVVFNTVTSIKALFHVSSLPAAIMLPEEKLTDPQLAGPPLLGSCSDRKPGSGAAVTDDLGGRRRQIMDDKRGQYPFARSDMLAY